MSARTGHRGARPREAEPRTLVFVYGTLLAGEPNHRYLKHARLIAEGVTRPGFTLYDLGAFPGLVRGGRHAVPGEVYEVDEPTLAAMDQLEGHPDFYCRSAITLTTGISVETYLLTEPQVAGRPIIVSGSWRLRHKDTRP